jgi:hypothetical protein
VADITVSITPVQLIALRRLDANLTAKQVLQAHIDTWLLPVVATLTEDERRAVLAAYKAADTTVQTQVKGLLGLG